VTVAAGHQIASGASSGTPGFHRGTLSRGSEAAQSDDSFSSLLVQNQSDASDAEARTVADDSETANSDAGGSRNSSSKRSGALLSRAVTTETQASSRRKKSTDEALPASPSQVTQAPDLSRAAQWVLSMISAGASATCSTADLGTQCSTTLPDQDGTGANAVPEGQTASESLSLACQLTDPMIGTENSISGATQGTVDAEPFAELSLTPNTTSVASVRATAANRSASPIDSPVSSSGTTPQADSSARSNSQSVTEVSAATAMLGNDFAHEGESSFEQPGREQKTTGEVLKKKAGSGSVQDSEPTASPDGGANLQSEQTLPIATSVKGPQEVQVSDEPPALSAPALEAVPSEPAKPLSSSVGTIELQVKVTDEKQVGLRLVERQGHVEIQLKSGDAQTAQALSDNLATLKTSLNENGWDVEDRIQTRLSPSVQGSPAGASTDRSSSALSQFESSDLSARAPLSALSATADMQSREAGDRSGLTQTLRTEQVSISQMSRQSGSDSSSSQDQSRSDRDASSGRNGQQTRHDGSGADSERQGRRSARDSEAWLDSIESNLTRSSSSRMMYGATK
jgi:hypothetical protein